MQVPPRKDSGLGIKARTIRSNSLFMLCDRLWWVNLLGRMQQINPQLRHKCFFQLVLFCCYNLQTPASLHVFLPASSYMIVWRTPQGYGVSKARLDSIREVNSPQSCFFLTLDTLVFTAPGLFYFARQVCTVRDNDQWHCSMFESCKCALVYAIDMKIFYTESVNISLNEYRSTLKWLLLTMIVSHTCTNALLIN